MDSRDGHANNFNLIRLFAATQVLLVHAFNHNEISSWAIEALKATPGVPIFFFISGYLISSSYLRMRQKSLVKFGRNRVLRIFPALIMCSLLSLLTVFLSGYLPIRSASAWQVIAWQIGQITFVQFYNPEFMRGYGVGVLNGALWTIAVELQFYILTPVLIAFRHKLKYLLAAVFVISLACNVYLGWFALDRSFVQKLFSVTFVPWVYMFIFGLIMASVSELRDWISSINIVILLFAYPISMVMIGGYTANAQNSINPISFLILAAIIFKIAFIKLPAKKALIAFFDKNDFSYGIYLYHMPTLNLFLFSGFKGAGIVPVIVGITVILASISWYWVERPALRRKVVPRGKSA